MSEIPIYGPQIRALTDAEHDAVSLVITATGVLGAVGFVNSFARVQAAAEPSFGWLAWTVPLGIDLGIAVFSALDIVLARLDMRLAWLRLVPWSLTTATVYLNIAGEQTPFGVVAHAVLPLLWVIAVEVGAHAIRVRAGLTSATHMDRIRRSRWLLAFFSTAALWRRMVLWEIRSYPDALAQERGRLLVLTELQDAYGRLAWRWKAPRRARALYRLGELVPATAVNSQQPYTVPAEHSAGHTAEEPAGPSAGAARSQIAKNATARMTRGRPTAQPACDVDDLMPLGRQIVAGFEEQGLPLTRDRLQVALRDAGRPTSNTRVGALLARLRADVPAEPRRAAADGKPPMTPITAPRRDGPVRPRGLH